MGSSKRFHPAWREDAPSPDSYRSIFKYGPNKFKHPSSGWYEMFKS